MVKTVLLSAEDTVVRLVESINDRVDIDLSYSECIEQNCIAEKFEEYVNADVELFLLCGLVLPESALKNANASCVTIGYSAMDFVRIRRAVPATKTIAVVAAENMLEFVGFAEEILPSDVRLFRVKNGEEIKTVVEAAVNAGADVVAGGADVKKCANELDVEYIHFGPGIESVRYALDAAQREKRLISAEKCNFAEKNALQYANFGGVIKIDAEGKIIAISDIAKQILGCRDKYVIGSYVLNVFNQLDKELLDAVLLHGENIIKHFTGARNKRCIVNVEPVFVDNKLVSAYISFQKAEQVAEKTGNEDTNKKATGRFSQYVYVSEVFGTLLKKAKFAAYTDAPILLHGEDGTETVGFANSIHNESNRYKMNFVEIECNAWDSDKMREILFGAARRGNDDEYSYCAVEAAEGGTLFLNHIDKLSMEMQYLVVQIIKGQYSMETGLFNRKSNVRVIAATDKDLRKMVTDGEFRRDLYYALNVISLEFPPLRERKEDIRCIVDLFVDYYGNAYSKPVSIAEAGYDCLLEYNWPGNTRQLEYFCKKLLLTAPSRKISEAYVRSMLLELSKSMRGEKEMPRKQTDLSAEASAIVEALRRNKGSKTKTAEDLGISKATLWRRMQKYGITTDFLA